MISATFPYQKKRQEVFGQEMAYVEVGQGDPIVCLHGNVTSSYLWRNVIPYLEGLGRCIAPDLIGMGDSDKLPNSGPDSYTFVEHRRYLDALLASLDVNERVTLVLHDWGSALGFDWANRHRDAVKGIAYMGAHVRPYTWDDFTAIVGRSMRRYRSEAGEPLVLEQNFFVEVALPGGVLRGLTAEEMAHYRRPFVEAGEGRRPILTWPRQLPINGEPADVDKIFAAYAQWLEHSTIPKLFINCDPQTHEAGMVLTGALRAYCRTWPAQVEVTVQGIHFPQEDSPDEVGQALAQWLKTLQETRTEKE
jgi:haloalkane dehalogenase